MLLPHHSKLELDKANTPTMSLFTHMMLVSQAKKAPRIILATLQSSWTVPDMESEQHRIMISVCALLALLTSLNQRAHNLKTGGRCARHDATI